MFVIISCDHVKMFPSSIIGGLREAALFCLHKGCCVCVATLFFYCDVFVTTPCDHEKMFPCFIMGDSLAFFAYIRMLCLLLYDVTM